MLRIRNTLLIILLCVCSLHYASASYIPLTFSNGSTSVSPVNYIQVNGDITYTDLGNGEILLNVIANPNGTVLAPISITDNSLVRGDGGATGIQGSGITVDDNDNISNINNLNVLTYASLNNTDIQNLFSQNTLLNGSVVIPSGASTGLVLTSDANGNATWQAIPSSADNLGSHIAGTNLNLNGFSLINAQDVNGNVANFVDGNFTNLNVTNSILYSNGAAAGLVLTSDANGNASWQTISSLSNLTINNGAISNSFFQDPTLNGFALFTNNSTLQVNGNFVVPGGTTGFVLTSDANGLATWQAIPSSADNLGSHIAGTNLNLNGFSLINAQDVNGNTANFNNINIASSINFANGAAAGLILTSDANGNATWQAAASLANGSISNGTITSSYLQDPTINGQAFFTNNSVAQFNGNILVPSGAGAGLVLTSDANGIATWQAIPSSADNLGSHIAGTNLNLNGFSLINAQDVNGNTANFNNVNIATSLNYANGAAAGLILTSDANGNATWQAAASLANGSISNGTITSSYLQDPTINGQAFFTNNSIAQFNGNILVPSGAGAGLVLTSDANGIATWQAIPSSADNLGSHIAGTNLNLNGFSLINAQDVNGNTANFNNVNIATSLNYANGAAAGFVLTSDINGNASWQAIAGVNNGTINHSTLNNGNIISSLLQDPTINGQAFFTNNSTAQFNGNILIPSGATAGFVLTTDANGIATWQAIPSSADNLGSHIAGTNLNLNGFSLINAQDINGVTANFINGNFANLDISNSIRYSNGAALGFVLSSDINGNASWTDLTTLTSNGDNLGNHRATTALNLANQNIDNANDLYFADRVGFVDFRTNSSFDSVNGVNLGFAFTTNGFSAPIYTGGLHIGGAYTGSAVPGDGQITTNGSTIRIMPNGITALRADTSSNIRIPNGQFRADQGIQFTNGAAAGFVLTSDANGNASWQAIAGVNNGTINNGTLLSSYLQDTTFNGFNLFTNNSIAQFNGGINIPAGAANGLVLTSDINGNATWRAIPSSADNLGSHIAGTNLNLNGFSLINAQDVNGNTANFNNGNFSNVHITTNIRYSNGAGAGFVLASDINGNASWTDLSTLSTNGDNLGNHTATNNIDVNGFDLNNVRDITISSDLVYTNGAAAGLVLTSDINGVATWQAIAGVNNGLINNATILNSLLQDTSFNGNIAIPTGAANGLVLTSDINGNATWRAIPSSADNLGSHIAGQNLNLNGFSLINAQDINGVTANFTNGNFSNVHITNNLRYSNGATAGFVLTSDINGNASWQAVAGLNNGTINNATILASNLQDSIFNGYNFFTDNSIAQFNGGINIPTGSANGLVLTSDVNGNATWRAIPSSADNLGSHIAGQNLNLNGFSLINANQVNGTTANFQDVNVSSKLRVNTTSSAADLNIGISNINTGGILLNNLTGSARFPLIRGVGVVANGTPNVDSFRLSYDGNFNAPNTDYFVFEKTDANQSDPDGGFVFTNTGNDGIMETSLIIEGSGNIGISTSTPAAMLDLGGGTASFIDGVNDALIADDLEVDGNVYTNGFIMPTGAATGLILTSDINGNASWQASPTGASGVNGSIQFANNGVLDSNGRTFHWDSVNGHLGIGTNNPDNILSIFDGNGRFNFSADTVISGYTTNFTLDNTGLKIGHNSSIRNIEFQTDSTTRATITNTGDFELLNNLLVNGTTTTNAFTMPTGAAAGFVLTSDINGNASWLTPALNAAGADGAIQFANNGSLSSNGRSFVWDNVNGRMGIGTNLPSRNLEINGDFLTRQAQSFVRFNQYDTAVDQEFVISIDNGTYTNTTSQLNFNAEEGFLVDSHNVEMQSYGTFIIRARDAEIRTNNVNGSVAIQGLASQNANLLNIGLTGNIFTTFDNGGRLGIGYNDALYSLQVNGTTYTQAFIMPTGAANGLVLMSDANGLASWQTPTASSASGANGAIQFSLNGALASDENNFFFDHINTRMSIGNNTPLGILDLGSTVNGAYFTVSGADGDLSIRTKKAAGDINIIPDNLLRLGTSRTDTVLIGRSDVSAPIFLRSNGTLTTVLRDNKVGLRVNYPEALLEVGNGVSNFIDGIGDALISDDLEVDGTIYVNGGIATSLTEGSVVFAGVNGALSEDNSNFFWDSSNGRLGIGTTTPQGILDLAAGSANGGFFRVSGANGDLRLSTKKGSSDLFINGERRLELGTISSDSIHIGRSDIVGTGVNLYSNGFTAIALNQNFGIGTSTPSQRLDVNGTTITEGFILPTGAANGLVLMSDANGVASWQTPLASVADGANGSVQFANNGVLDSNGRTFFWDDNNGRLGIGTNTPAANLSIIDTIPTINLGGSAVNQTESGRIRFTESNIGSSPFFQGSFIHYNGSANIFNIGVHHAADSNVANDLNALSIERSSGNIAIRDLTPEAFLDVGGGSADFIDGVRDLLVADDLEVDGNLYVNGSLASNLTEGSVVFAGLNGTLSENGRFFWDDANGRLGIGTATPSQLLEVSAAGTAGIQSTDTTVGNYARFTATGAASYPRGNFVIGDPDDVMTNTALWVTPGGAAQTTTTLEALTNSDTTVNATKRAGVMVRTDRTIWFSAQGNGSDGNTPIYITTDGSVSTATPGIFIADPGNGQNIGISTINPLAKLSINGDIQILDGSQANGFILISDANGVGSWVDPSSVSSSAQGANGAIQFALNGALASDDANFVWEDSNNYMGIGTDTPSSTLELNGALSFTHEFNNGNSGATITVDFVNGNKQRVTLDANTTITLDAPGVGNYLLKVVQDATGSRTVTWAASGGGAVRWPSGVAPTLSTTANAIDIVSCYYDGTDYFCLGNLNFI